MLYRQESRRLVGMTLLRRLAGVALALALVTGVPGGPLDLAPALHAQATGQLYFSVVDQTGSPITDMTADEFSVSLGGTGCEILSATLNEPMRVTVLVDNSEGTRGEMVYIRRGLERFLDGMPQGHEIALITLARNPRWIVRHTTNREQLKEGVGLIQTDRASGSTFLDALVEAGGRFEDAEGKRSVIVAITNNGDGSSHSNQSAYERLVNQVSAHGATVHALVLTTNRRGSGLQLDVARNLTQMTGGQYEALNVGTGFPDKLESLAEEISRHQAELATQYRVIYALPESVPPGSTISAGVRRASGGVGNFSISLDGRLEFQ